MCKSTKQESIDSIQDTNNFRKIIETGNKITLGTLIKEDSTYTDPGEDTIKYILSKHFPDSQYNILTEPSAEMR